MTTTADSTTITVDTFLPHPPQRVWHALVIPDQLRSWFMPNDIKPVVGHRFTFTRPMPNPDLHFSDTIQCEVLQLHDEALLSYSWTDAAYPGEMDSTVTWTVQPEGTGTRLTVQHCGFAAGDPIQQRARDLMTGGWTIYLGERLATYL